MNRQIENYIKTDRALQAAREYAAGINNRLAAGAFHPDAGFASHVTDADRLEYVRREVQTVRDILAGKLDHNFTVWQRMNYFLTGESVPFLP